MNTDRLQELIFGAMDAEKTRITNELVERFKSELEKQLRDYAAKAAVNICRKVSFEPYGQNAIRIIVEFPGATK